MDGDLNPIGRASRMNIVSSRLVVRALERKDASFLAALVNDPEVRDTLGSYELVFPVAPEAEERWVEKALSARDSARMIIALKSGVRPIGMLGVDEIDRRNASARVSILLERGQWGKGYGTEALSALVEYMFGRMNMHRLWLKVDAGNARAIRCFEKCGFRREGVLRQDHFAQGRWADSLVMSMIADDLRGRAP